MRLNNLAFLSLLFACGQKTGEGVGVSPSASASNPGVGATPVSNVAPVGVERLSAPLSFAPIAKAVDPSVVTIQVVGDHEVQTRFGKKKLEGEGLGTGFFIDTDGTILTNNHVVEGAKSIRVRLFDEREFPARVVGVDPRTDIGVIQLEIKDPRKEALVAVSFGDSDVIEVGDWVVAIGNPFGLTHTVSAGIVSAKNRSKKDVPLDPSGFYDFLQTDAAINQGNSGGPLINLDSRVIGINSAIRGGGAQNIGFAIPINMVKQLLPLLLRDGKISRSALDIVPLELRQVPDVERERLKIPSDAKGVLIEDVTANGAAELGGLLPGDLVVEFNGTQVTKANQLAWIASMAGVGKSISVKVLRDGKPVEKRVKMSLLKDAPKAP